MKFDLCDYLERQIMWSEKTFGPGHHPYRNTDHILKEVREIILEPRSLEEWVDVAMLAFDGAMRAGFNPSAIARQLEYKLGINRGRTWPDWRTQDPNAAIEHIKTDGPAPEPKPRRTIPGFGEKVRCLTCQHEHEIHAYHSSQRANDRKSVLISSRRFQRFVCPACKEDAVYEFVGASITIFARWVRPSTVEERAVDLETFNLYNQLTTGESIPCGADDATTAAGISGGAVDGGSVQAETGDGN